MADSFLLPSGPSSTFPVLAGWQEGGWNEDSFPANPRCQRQLLPRLLLHSSIGRAPAAAVAAAAATAGCEGTGSSKPRMGLSQQAGAASSCGDDGHCGCCRAATGYCVRERAPAAAGAAAGYRRVAQEQAVAGGGAGAAAAAATTAAEAVAAAAVAAAALP
jgi:hypothetical protein